MSELNEFIPLSERAIRRDGTISLKIIEPGWGSSGYYGRDILERDIPKVFPAGTKMFWNHQTASEEMERPEGDLNDLAAVTVTDPIWLESGPKGPGMYAESKVFAGYSDAIDEIGEHIGVSIRGRGRHTTGEAEGKQGRIIQEIVDGKSVDFVTEPGAGGAVVQIFESAPGAAPLPNPSIATFLSEAGRVLSKANETKLKAALEQLTAVLSLLDSGETSEAAAYWVAGQIKEALSNNDLRERLHDKLKNRFGGKDTYVWPRDWSIDDSWVVFEVSTQQDTTIYRLGMTTTQNDVLLAESDPVEVRIVTRYEPITSSDVEEAANGRQLTMEDAMSEQELKEAQDALAAAMQAKSTAEQELAKMQERLILSEAKDFVTAQLAETELPDVTKDRLAKTLAANPPAKDGQLDTDVFQVTVQTAVTEAQAEIAALLGKDGKVTGNGESASENNGEQPTIKAARARLNESLATMGYGGENNG